MSGRPAIIKQRDVERILKGAAAAGVTLGITVKNGEVHFLPIDQIKPAAEPSALEKFKAERDARKASKARGHT